MRLTSLLRFAFLIAAGLLLGHSLHAQQNWRYVNPLPGGVYKAVAYGAGLYVAVGNEGVLATSPDAVTWTIRRHPALNFVLNDVTFAAGRFMAVGQDAFATTGSAAYILTSTDGITWTQGTFASPFSSQLFTVLHTGTSWLAAGLSSPPSYAVSTDGLTWTTRGSTTGDGLIRGAYGNGRFVFTNDGNRANTSTDGITWTRSFIVGNAETFNVSFSEIVFANGAFFVAARDATFNSAVYTSTDGATWTPAAAPIADSSGGAFFIDHDAGKFVLGGNGGLFTSTNGTTWTKRTSALPAYSTGTEAVGEVSVANGVVFCLGLHGGISTSADGVTFTRRGSGSIQALSGLVHDGTRFVATGAAGTVQTSPDGITWTTVASGQTAALGKLAFGNGRYASADLNGLRHSANLTTWTAVTGTTFNQMFGVIFANNRFIAANNALALGIRTSTDGSTWTNVTVSGTAFQEVKGLAGGGGNFVITTGGFGPTPKIFASSDGATWTDRTPAAFVVADSLAYGNGTFVLLTSFAAWTSPDGVTWTSNPFPSASYVTRVMFVGTKFLARKPSDASYRSSLDGVTWTDVANSGGPATNAEAMVEKDNFIISVGGGGMIMRGEVAATVTPTTLAATVASGATVQWQRNGANVTGATNASLTLSSVAPGDAGIYSALVTTGGTATSQSFVVGVSATTKVVGTGTEVGSNILHANGNTFDQVLLQGVAASFTADAGQVTRMSFVDLQDDIVQVEFSGAGTVSVVLENATGPAAPVNYNQPTVSYMRGHAGIVVTGANETTNLSVFSVGRGNAVNQALFRDDVTYDGLADISFIAIQSTNGKFGGLRTANASYLSTKGLTGLYAPNVEFAGPVFVGDINASDHATPVLMLGSNLGETRITGGNLEQANGRAVQVSGLTQLLFTAGSTSHNGSLTAKTNLGRLEQNGTNVTAQIVVNPTP